MQAVEFEVKSHELDKPTLYRLDDTGFSWKNPKSEGHFRYEDIAAIHMMVFDSNYGRGRMCTIRNRNGKKRVFRSLHCFGFGTFEDRAAGYAPFVRQLLRQVAEKAPKAKITRGSTFGYIILIIGLMLLVGSGAIVVLAAFSGIAPDPSILAFAAFIVLMIPVVLGFMKRIRPRTFDPLKPSADLVGDDGDTRALGENA